MAIKFNQFTEGDTSTISSDDYLIGYDTPIPGGERRYTISTLSNVVSSLIVDELINTIVNNNVINNSMYTIQTNAGKRLWTDIAGSQDGTVLYACAYYDYIFKSTDSGQTWNPLVDSKIRTWYNIKCSPNGNTVAAASVGNTSSGQLSGRAAVSLDGGISWTQATMPLYIEPIIAISDNGQFVYVLDKRSNFLYVSSDYGSSYIKTNVSILASGEFLFGICCNGLGNVLYAQAAVPNSSGRIIRSSDYGVTWTNVAGPNTFSLSHHIQCNTDGSICHYQNNTGLSKVTNNGSNFFYLSGSRSDQLADFFTDPAASSNGDDVEIGGSIRPFKVNQNGSKAAIVFRHASTPSSFVYYSDINTGVLISDDVNNGESFKYRGISNSNGIDDYNCTGLTMSEDGQKIALCFRNSYIFTSTDQGDTWTLR